MPGRLKSLIVNTNLLFRVALIAVIAICLTRTVQATLIQETYTAFVQRMLTAFDQVTRANELSKDEERLVRRLAAMWFFEGPCMGNADLTSTLRDGITISFVPNADPTRRVGRATIEVIGLLIRENFGRPNETTCRFALETAVPEVKVLPNSCVTASCRK
jgi:hypothetical protein